MCKKQEASGSLAKFKKGERQTVDLATFADGNKYCLVAAVTIEVEKESKLLPIFVPMPKKDSISAIAALKEALTPQIFQNPKKFDFSKFFSFWAFFSAEKFGFCILP